MTRFLVLLLALSLAANAFLFWRWRGSERTAGEARRYVGFVMDSLGAEVTFPRPPEGPAGRDSIYWQWVATAAQLQSRRWQRAVQYWRDQRAVLLDPEDVAMFQRAGLDDPARQLRDSLMAHPEVIPFEPVLGGTMFFPPSEIVLLQPPYVFAGAEDGHVGGRLLLRYQVLGDRSVRWRTLWSARE